MENQEKERIKRLKELVKKIPLNPGIYLMKDIDGNIIYVGKAKSLRKRVSQYFNKTNKSIRIEKMVEQIQFVEYIVTHNELEALVLECNYIKEHMPKYNVMLKDDKSYPYIKITAQDKYPGIYITRNKRDDKSMYFGPYTDVRDIREKMQILKEIFPLKRCKTNFNKSKPTGPCLYYHIGRCLGPCINEIAREEYMGMINQIILFLQGKTSIIETYIKEDIERCITRLDFEKAAKLKERLDNISKIKDRQIVSNVTEVSTDVFGYILKDNLLYMQVFKIRDSKLLKHDNIEFEDIDKKDLNKVLQSILSQYYTNKRK